jgi:hypothetical protein
MPVSKVEFYSPHIGNNVGHQYTYHANGSITCRACGTAMWCDHLEEAAWKNWDCLFFPSMDSTSLSFPLMIPMFPSADMWTTVLVFKVDGRDIWQIMWLASPTSISLDPASSAPPVFVCFLNPGEGRSTIRSVLIELMWGDGNRTRECKASHHGMLAQKHWTDHKDTNLWTQECWSVYTSNWCLWCRLNDTSTAPDLIPSNESRF